jgi:pimeloyl-ACP methyl ester carboxylesterase
MEWIPEATHWVQHDAPERVNALLVDFLRDGDPPAGAEDPPA